MTRDLSRLLKPGSIAVIGDLAWCNAVIAALQSIGYVWDIWPVHATEAKVAGIRAFPGIADLPHAPDAAFVGLEAHRAVQTVSALAQVGSGGVFLAAEFDSSAYGLAAVLQEAAGDMPILGPNCGSFINALDRVALWPEGDRLSHTHIARGVAILTQDMPAMHAMAQGRGLPIGYLATVGDATLTCMADLGTALLCDPRVTALGLHIESIGDLRRLEALATTARRLGKSIVVLKSMPSAQTAETQAGLTALLARLGMARVSSLEALLETLKLLHFIGPLPANLIAALNGAQAEGTSITDAAARHGIAFAPLGENQETRLREVLGSEVLAANPLSFHFNLQNDAEGLSDVFTQMMQGGAVLTLVMLDVAADRPRAKEEVEPVLSAAAQAHAHVGMPLAMVIPKANVLPEDLILQMGKDGVIPMMGLDATMEAIAAAISLGGIEAHPAPLLLPQTPTPMVEDLRTMVGAEALEAIGLTPKGADPGDKSKVANLVRLQVLADPAHGYLLTLEAEDEEPKSGTPLLLPAARHEILTSLEHLLTSEDRTSDEGRDEALNAVMAVQDYVASQAGQVVALMLKLRILHASGATFAEAVIKIATNARERNVGIGPQKTQ